jgi:hypothetical protein
MLARKRSLFSKELILTNVLKALASIISTCSLHVCTHQSQSQSQRITHTSVSHKLFSVLQTLPRLLAVLTHNHELIEL